MNTIGVAIVTYNSAQDIEACLQSVMENGVRDISIVDSASYDTTVQEISRLGFDCKSLPGNKGFGYAANRAAESLNTEYVLFLNPDAKLPSGIINHFKKTLDQHEGAGVIGMLLCDSAGKPERMAYGDEPTLFTMLFRRFLHKKPLPIPFRTDWVSGGALCVRNDVFRELRGFDEGFFLYWEDVDICTRARQKGYEVLIDPTSRVVHARGGSNLDVKEKTHIYDTSADRYFKKHYSSTIWRIQRFLRRLYRL